MYYTVFQEPEEQLEKAEETVEAEEEFHSDVSVEGEEYIPPGGLFVPGLYSPPNDLAKANGLAFFFPKVGILNSVIWYTGYSCRILKD